MLHGEWPSRDFVDLGAPLTYAISAAAQAVFGRAPTDGSAADGGCLRVRSGPDASRRRCADRLGPPWRRCSAHRIAGLSAHVQLPEDRALRWGSGRVPLVRQAGRLLRASCVLPRWRRCAALVRHDHGLYIGIASVVAVALSPIPSDRYKGGMSVAILAAAVFSFMLPYFVYLQTADGIIAHLQRGAAFTALEVPRQRLTMVGLLRVRRVAAGRRVACADRCARAPRRSPRPSSRGRVDDRAPRRCRSSSLRWSTNAGLIRDRLDVRLPDAIVAPALLMVWLVYQAWRMPPRAGGARGTRRRRHRAC